MFRYWDQLATNATNRRSNLSQLSFTGTAPALPTAYNTQNSTNAHSGKTMHATLNSSRKINHFSWAFNMYSLIIMQQHFDEINEE